MYLKSELAQIQHLSILCYQVNISQLPATYMTRKEYRPEEANEGLKTDSTPPPPGGHRKPVAKEDASAHKTQTPDRGQL